MAAWRRAIELSLGDADVERLRSIAQSRSEPASRVERARIVLAYQEDPSFFAVGRALGLHHQTVQRCVERAVVEGAMAALDDRPRPGKEPTITIEAKAWLTSLACRKAKDLGYPPLKVAELHQLCSLMGKSNGGHLLLLATGA
jgi:transposase